MDEKLLRVFIFLCLKSVFKKFNFLILNDFFIILDCILILKINFKNKKITILMYFKKQHLKNQFSQ